MSDTLLTKLEELGEDAVRIKLAEGAYGSRGLDRMRVEDWLNQKFLSRSADAERRKHIMDIVALIAATIAATAATIGAVASIILILR